MQIDARIGIASSRTPYFTAESSAFRLAPPGTSLLIENVSAINTHATATGNQRGECRRVCAALIGNARAAVDTD